MAGKQEIDLLNKIKLKQNQAIKKTRVQYAIVLNLANYKYGAFFSSRIKVGNFKRLDTELTKCKLRTPF
ncbi:hypothetical protein D0T87_05450 [Bacteroides sp. 51]|nr:hypothetical protein [Bacteroides sp. 51]